MEPVVSPWAIYFIGLCDKVNNIVLPLALLIGLGSIIVYITVSSDCYSVDDIVLDKHRVWFCPMVVTAIVLALVAFIMPTKEVAIAMVASSYITPDNIMGTEEHVIAFIKKVAEAVK